MITADRSSRRRATAIGLLAIVMWAGLALLTDMTGGVPPFQLAAMSFAVGALVGLPWLRTGGGIAGLPHDWRVWL
nr:EamA family transporter [Rhizobiaceae bacterium]